MVAVYQGQHMLAGGTRKGAVSYDPDEAYDIDMQLSMMGDIARRWQEWFGTLEGLTLKYEKLTLTFQPLDDGRFLVLSSEPKVDPIATTKKIRSRPDFDRLTCLIP